ncbi:unnamed protein product [Ectocarpus fasciculatus]
MQTRCARPFVSLSLFPLLFFSRAQCTSFPTSDPSHPVNHMLPSIIVPRGEEAESLEKKQQQKNAIPKGKKKAPTTTQTVEGERPRTRLLMPVAELTHKTARSKPNG